MIGVCAAALSAEIVFPIIAGDELRLSLGRALRSLGRLYGLILRQCAPHSSRQRLPNH